jgi:hypothetical protein
VLSRNWLATPVGGRKPQPGKRLVEHRAHRLGEELARQPQPGPEPLIHPAMLPRRRLLGI